MHSTFAGILRQDEDGYSYTYNYHYLNSENPVPVSLTLPLRKESFHSNTIIPFFDGLIPEGWFLESEAERPVLNPRDRMGLLLSLGKDCIGAVSIIPVEEAMNE
jgi:serine/threonine-protein kinase HipA